MTKPTNEPGIDFDRGELVRVRMEPLIVGQVIGEKDWGSSFLVRLGGSTEAYWFENVELETYVPDEAGADFGRTPPKTSLKKPKSADVVQFAEYRRTKGGIH